MKKWGPEEQTVLERHCGDVKQVHFSCLKNTRVYFQLQHFFLFFYTTATLCSCSVKGSHLIIYHSQHFIIITRTFSSVSIKKKLAKFSLVLYEQIEESSSKNTDVFMSTVGVCVKKRTSLCSSRIPTL